MKRQTIGFWLLVGILTIASIRTNAQTTTGLQGLSHVVLPIRELGVSLPFYRNVLGLAGVAVPGSLANTQAWFDLGGGQQLRLVERRTDVSGLRTGGMQVAIQTNSLKQTEQQLKQRSAAVSRQVGVNGRPALQLTDPDGYVIEIYEGRANKPGFLQSAGNWVLKSITSVD